MMNNNKRESSIAIDLGTTNCVCSYVKEDGTIELIPNKDGGLVTPTFIHLKRVGMKLETTVGEKAKKMVEIDPTNIISSFKTLMGTKTAVKSIPLMGSITSLHGSYLMIKYLKESAEEFLERNITSAVVTVPAYFDESQKSATKLAGKMAGLVIENIVNEPTAATFYYGLESKTDEFKTVLAYDLGGGTFDVSIIQVVDDSCIVIGTAGDNKLGGDDIDHLIANLILSKIGERINKPDKSYHEKILGQAESLKIQLCDKVNLGIKGDIKAEVSVPTKATHELEDGVEEVIVTMTLEEFEDLINPLLKRTLSSVTEAFEMANVGVEDLDEVILIGGSTKIPYIKTLLIDYLNDNRFDEDYFEKFQLDPDLAVGLGAGMFLKYLLENKLSNLTDIVTKSLGVEDHEGQQIPLLKVGRTLPASKSKTFVNSQDHQDCFNLNIYEGESTVASKNNKIGSITIPIKPSPKGTTEVLVKYTLSTDGTLKVRAVTGEESIDVEIEREYDENIKDTSETGVKAFGK